jgi:DNA-binding GntR family transcriptional regulator
VRKELLGDQVHDHLLADIMSGELRPGDRIIEKRVAAELSVSNAPIREAIRRLVAEGLVTTTSYSGAVVRERPVKEMIDIYEVRVVLECRAVRDALANGDVEQLLQSLRQTHAEMRDVASRGDVTGLVGRDIDFHGHIFDAALNSFLATTAKPVMNQIGAITAVSNLVYFEDLLEVADTHLPLIAAIESRDPNRAEHAVIEHSGRVWQRAAERNPWLTGELQGAALLMERFSDVLSRPD